MYKLTTRQKQLGLGCKGVTTYFSDNCDQEDADRITKYVSVQGGPWGRGIDNVDIKSGS